MNAEVLCFRAEVDVFALPLKALVIIQCHELKIGIYQELFLNHDTACAYGRYLVQLRRDVEYWYVLGILVAIGIKASR